MPANFNPIARIYDRLSAVVFGNTLKRAQKEQLLFIRPNSTILIIGGGTGWILEEIAKIHYSGLEITYVDNSTKMIAQSQKRNAGSNSVIFVTCPIEELTLEGNYDVIITSFLFDMFPLAVCNKLIQRLSSCLNKGALWLYCDFQLTQKSGYRQKIILGLMYAFFRLCCRIEAKKLPDVEACFLYYNVVGEKTYCRNFITSKIFKKEFTS